MGSHSPTVKLFHITYGLCNLLLLDMKYPSNEHPIFFASTFHFILLYVVVLRVCSAESGLKPVHPKRTSDGPKVAIGFKPDPAEQALKSSMLQRAFHQQSSFLMGAGITPVAVQVWVYFQHTRTSRGRRQ